MILDLSAVHSNVISTGGKEPLDLEIGDTIIWRGDGMRNEEGIVLISARTRGKVITRSENLLAQAARKEGLPITAGPWVLVDFENGFRMVVDSRVTALTSSSTRRAVLGGLTAESPGNGQEKRPVYWSYR